MNREERRRAERENKKWEKQLKDAIAKGALQPGSLTIMNVYHDNWCPKLNGGDCTCDPDADFRIVPKGEKP